MRRRKDFLGAICIAVLLHTAILLYAVVALPGGSQRAAGPGPGHGDLSVVVTLETPPPELPPVAAAPTPEPPPPVVAASIPEPSPSRIRLQRSKSLPAPAPQHPVVSEFQGPPSPETLPVPASAPVPAPSMPVVADASSASGMAVASSGVEPSGVAPSPTQAQSAQATESAGGGPGVPVISSGALDIRPRYPASSRMRGEEGLVRLLVKVLPSGRAEKVNVAATSGYPALDKAAVNAVKKAKFPMRDLPLGSAGEILLSFRFQLVEAAL